MLILYLFICMCMCILDNFLSVTEENFNLPMKVISGAIPADLNGLFLRVGPNMIEGHNYDRR